MTPNAIVSGQPLADGPLDVPVCWASGGIVNRKLTAEECFARAEAYEECADHLALEWTNDPVEKQAGEMVEKALRIRVKKWRSIGQQRTRPNE